MTQTNTYTIGEFSKRANVSNRTIRYYDKIGLLKPSYLSEANYRLYTDQDFFKLQKIIVLKNLGFSLDDISGMTLKAVDNQSLRESFDLQLSLIQTQIVSLKKMEQTLLTTSKLLIENESPNWNKLIPMIHLLNMQEDLHTQYKNAQNVEVRIRLHQKYSTNPQGWYPWLFSHMRLKENQKILEIGCGNGQLWLDNIALIPNDCQITLSDRSDGMLKKAYENLSSDHLLMNHQDDNQEPHPQQIHDNLLENQQSTTSTFNYQCFDCSSIPYGENQFDLVIANHLLFYLEDLHLALSEIKRVLKPGGFLFCSTYGSNHMKEIDQLVKEYDSHIALSEIKLYDLFGLQQGVDILSPYFNKIKSELYPDSLLVTDPSDLLEYIYSCHGNQMSCLQGQINNFEKYVSKKVGTHGLSITKEAGYFICQKY